MSNERSRCILLAAFLLALGVTLASAHEGHKAISSKGVKIDDKGLLHLEPQTRKAIGLTTVKVDFGTIEVSVRLNSRLLLPWGNQAYASARVEGFVREVLVRPGETVKAGAPLAILESLPLDALRMELDQKTIELSLFEQNLSRAQELGESIVPGREILILEADRDQARNAITILQMKLQLIGEAGSSQLRVTAPIDGVVADVDVVTGQHVEPMQHLFKIHDLRTVWAECEIPENLVGMISVGQEVRLVLPALPGESFSGSIDLLDYHLDPAKSVRKSIVRLDNGEGHLIPGMFGTAEVVLRRAEETFVAPRSAIVTDGAERYAFVQVKEGVYRMQYVVLGLANLGRVEITDGLYPGDTVVASGNHELSSLYAMGTLVLSDEAKRNIGYAVEEVNFRTVDRVIRVNATVATPPRRRAVAISRIPGRIERFHVELGQKVTEGQPLFDVESLDLQNSQLDLIRIDLQLDLVVKQLEFLRPLAAKGIPPRKEILRHESHALVLKNRFETVRRSLIKLGLTEGEMNRVVKGRTPLSVVTVRAPIDGRVGRAHAVIGQVVAPGEVVFSIVDHREIWIEGTFFESDLAELAGAQEKSGLFRAVALPGREWVGRISFVDSALFSGKNVLRGWVTMENGEDALLMGMRGSLSVTVAASEEEVIAVPLQAIISIGRRHYVFVEQGNVVKRVEVNLGRRDSHHAEVTRNLYPGDRVVVSGVSEVNNAHSAVR